MKIWKTSEEQSEEQNETILDPISEEIVICPFCKEDNFDFIGLKSHLVNGDCEIFNRTNVSNLRRIF